MRIAVTGATGNLGSMVLHELAAACPEHEVVGLARRPPASGTGPPAAAWREVDLSGGGSAEVLAQAFAGVGAVVHTAWGFQPTRDPAYLHELAVGGTQRVLAAAASAGVRHLVHVSSLGAYSPRRDLTPVREDWRTEGIATSRYSQDKVAAERLLDRHEAGGGLPRVARVRPGIMGRREVASGLLRYTSPPLLSPRLARALPVLPLDRSLVIPMLHTHDAARAIRAILLRGATGAFNLTADPPITPPLIAEALGARHVHLPGRLLRRLVDLSWRAHLQPVDVGWIDMALTVPLLDASRAREELDWAPTTSGDAALRQVVEGMLQVASDDTPILRRRTVADQLGRLPRHGPPSRRHRP